MTGDYWALKGGKDRSRTRVEGIGTGEQKKQKIGLLIA